MRRVAVLLGIGFLMVGCIDTTYSQPETRGKKREDQREERTFSPKARAKALQTESETSAWPTREGRNAVGEKVVDSAVGSAFPTTAQPTLKVPAQREKGPGGPRS
ncbi:MAG: hypothetical protein ACOYON_02780 [Fimbriimonas sp.]